MPARRIDEGVVEVAAMLLMGDKREDMIIASEGSSGLVDEITKIMRETMGPTFDKVREIFQMARKHEITADDVKVSSGIAVTMKMLNIDVRDFASWLTDLYKETKKGHSLEPSQFGSLLSLVYQIMKKEGILPKDLPKKIKEMCEVQEALNEAKEDLKRSLAENSATLPQIESYGATKKAFEAYGISLYADIPKIANLFTNCKDSDYDMNKLLRTATAFENLRARNEQATKNLQDTERAFERNRVEIHEQENKIKTLKISYEKKKQVHETVEDLFASGMNSSYILALWDIHKKYGTEPQITLEKLDRFLSLNASVEVLEATNRHLLQDQDKLFETEKKLQETRALVEMEEKNFEEVGTKLNALIKERWQDVAEIERKMRAIKDVPQLLPLMEVMIGYREVPFRTLLRNFVIIADHVYANAFDKKYDPMRNDFIDFRIKIQNYVRRNNIDWPESSENFRR